MLSGPARLLALLFDVRVRVAVAVVVNAAKTFPEAIFERDGCDDNDANDGKRDDDTDDPDVDAVAVKNWLPFDGRAEVWSLAGGLAVCARATSSTWISRARSLVINRIEPRGLKLSIES